ncbi:hypothetical protein PSCICE_12630 [Pseudomonas cichorii]|nr:hypothetical protein [Pseudomonas cichorii]GFM49996.1 hypothetical protein PSCICE_12630 [Pseudomonas cichorii]
MWLDRFTGEQCRQLPALIQSGRYQSVDGGPTFNGHTPVFTGVLVNDGDQRCQLGHEALSFTPPQKTLVTAMELLSKVITTIDGEAQLVPLISPLMPASIIDAKSYLQPFEVRLLDVVKQGHLHNISQRPRLDLNYEDEVADIGRARRLAKGALVHLASHSECWQRQTLSGVVPKKVLARFSEDDYGIYENRVYARLLDKIEHYLRVRLAELRGLQDALDQALRFYESENVHHRLRDEICRLWGQTFNEAQTSSASKLLSETHATLERLHRTISGLQQGGLYLLVSRQAQITGALHLTNILSHDQHYRHLANLWDLLAKTAQADRATPAERLRQNQYFAAAYSNYAGLVMRHALFPYLNGKDEGEWAGRRISLQQAGLEWQLVSASLEGAAPDEVLLTIVPWFSDAPQSEVNLQSENRFIVWPAIGREIGAIAYLGQWIPLSPSDMYCIERFGLLVDQALCRMALHSYGQPLSKISKDVLAKAEQHSGAQANPEWHELSITEALSDEAVAALKDALITSNSTRQAADLECRNKAILSLEKCPVCAARVRLVFQSPVGFRANCKECRTERYLRQQEKVLVFEQMLSEGAAFSLVGRRAFSIEIHR